MKKQLLFLILFLCYTKNFAQPNLSLSLVSQGFNNIVDISHAGDRRLFIVEQPGVIKIVTFGGKIQSTPFLDIKSKVLWSGEMGLLGLVFHPQYKQNGYFYVNYINKNQNTVVERYSISQTDSTVADSTSGAILLTFPQPYTNHNGGDLNFGPDGYLYISTGDGGSGGDPLDNGQNKTTFLGKILRIDVNAAFPYAIPAGNPFADGAGGNVDEIWSYGLRNPWRFSFDKLTGDMLIADVGQNAYEEIDFEPSGSAGGINYGWRCYEGNHTYNSTNCLPSSSYTFPVYEYAHSEGCSVTGGYVYRGNAFPILQGNYLYADYCTGRIWSLKKDGDNWVNAQLFQDASARFTTFGENKDGELFIGDKNGKLYQICELNTIANNPNLTINDNPILTGEYQAGYQINSIGSVANLSNVGFYAYKAIILEPGFRVDNGAVFKANVGVCTTW